jgi:hypothetical protein
MQAYLIPIKLWSILFLVFGVPLLLVMRAMIRQMRSGNISRFQIGKSRTEAMRRFALAPLGALPFATIHRQWAFVAMICLFAGALTVLARRYIPAE